MKLARRLNQSSENGFSTSDFKDILGEIEMKVGCYILSNIPYGNDKFINNYKSGFGNVFYLPVQLKELSQNSHITRQVYLFN